MFTDRPGEPLVSADAPAVPPGTSAPAEDADTLDHRRSREAQEILAAASAVLGRSLDLRETADAIARAAIPRFADWAVVDALDEDGRLARLALAHGDPDLLAAAEEMARRWPPDFERRATTHSVLTTGEPVLLSDLRDEDFAPFAQDGDHFAAWKRFRVRSCVAVPLDAAGERLGVLTLLAGEGGRRYTSADLPLALELGRRAATALINARLFLRVRRAHAEAEAARDRTDRLQRLSAELTRSLTPDAVVDVVVRHLVLALGARSAAVFELSADGRELELLGDAGVDTATRERVARIPVDTPLPVGDVVRTRAPALLENSTAWLAAHPDVLVMPQYGDRAWAALPLRVEDGLSSRLLGALTVVLPGPHLFPDEERGFLQAFADLCAQALDRARLFEAEATARALTGRLQALIVALAHARTRGEVVQVFVKEAAEAVGASEAGVGLLSIDGRTFTMAGFAGADEAVREAWRTFPNTTALPYGAVVAERAPLFIPSRAVYGACFPELEPALAAAGIEAAAVLPLVAGDGRALGAVHFDFRERRAFAAATRQVFGSIAQQCVAALERVHLYEAERARVAAVAGRREAETARTIAEAASRAKDELLAFVSHELRAPLAPARALAQVLARADALAPEFRETAAEIERHIAAEARLVENLLEYQRAGQGQLRAQCRPCDLGGVARGALRAAGAPFRAKGIAVEEAYAAEDAVAWADPFRVEEIVYNLLTNAAKFSPHGATVVVRMHNPVPGWVELAVEDTGYGIAPHELPRLFAPFTQVGGPQSPHSGLGLGLALSRRLAELQGGTLTAASEGLGRGATFVLRLPTARAAATGTTGAGAGPADAPTPAAGARKGAAPETTAAEAAGGEGGRTLRILLIEDEGSTATALRRLLSVHGHVVHVAHNLAAAERIAGAEPLDVLLSDVLLGGESGLEAPRRVAEAARRCGRPAPPAVVLSGLTRESDMAESRAAGFLAHLGKPVDEQVLLQALWRTVAVGDPRADG